MTTHTILVYNIGLMKTRFQTRIMALSVSLLIVGGLLPSLSGNAYAKSRVEHKKNNKEANISKSTANKRNLDASPTLKNKSVGTSAKSMQKRVLVWIDKEKGCYVRRDYKNSDGCYGLGVNLAGIEHGDEMDRIDLGAQ